MKKSSAKKPGRPKRTQRAAKPELPSLYVAVHELWLETRSIAQREDELCTMLHEIRKTGKLSIGLRGELRRLLEETRVYLVSPTATPCTARSGRSVNTTLGLSPRDLAGYGAALELKRGTA